MIQLTEGISSPSDNVLAVDQIVILADGYTGNFVTTQVNGTQLALDVGIDVAGVQIDPRSIRALTASDVVTANQGGTWTVKTSNFPTTVDTNYGTVGASTIRTASQIGNVTGAADFNTGATTAQTLRITNNTSDGYGIQIGSTVISGKAGLNVNVVNPTSSTISNFPTTVDTNYGTVGASTIRTASQIGNATGAADFNRGATSAQTLRVTNNTNDGYGTAISSTGSSLNINVTNAALAVTQSTSPWVVSGTVATSNFPTTVDTNYGTVGVNTIRTASQIGNATGAANFNVGATGAQTLRVTSNLSDGYGNQVSSLTTGGATYLNVNALQAGTWNIGTVTSITNPVAVTQSGAWTTGRTWTLASGTDSVSAVQSGTWTVQQGSAPWSFTGNLTNNNAAPAANNVGALIALAEGTLSASRYTTGDQVLLVTDLAGNTNVDLQYYLGAAVSKTNPIATTISDGTNVITAAISAYGTAPTGTEVMGVNAYITNTPTVNQGTSPWVTKDQSDGPVAPGTVASFSQLAGGQYNSTPPTLTNTQQSALQLDAAGRLLVDANITFPYDTNYGTVGSTTLRTASQIGNATGGANFNVGATGAQTLRVTSNTSDGYGNQIGSLYSGGSNYLNVNPLQVDLIGSGTIAALNQAVTIATAGFGSLTIVITGTWSGTITAQGTDGDGTWFNIYSYQTYTGGIYSAAGITGNTSLLINCAGYYQVRLLASAWTSGTATASYCAGAYPHLLQAYQVTSAANFLVTAYLTDGYGNAISSTTGSINTYLTNDRNYGTVGANTLRTASQIGNATGAADFNTGATTAQTLRTTSNLSDGYGNQIGSTVTAGINRLNVTLASVGSSAPGTAAAFANLEAGVYNTTLPTLTNGQQSAIQLDSSGRLIIAPTTQGILAEDHNYGTVGSTTLRTASQIGNATGAADFNKGATSAQTLRTTSNLSDGYGNQISSTTSAGQTALNVSIVSTIQPLYGTNNQALTITLASLANAAARGSTAVNNSTTLYEDVLLFFKITTGTGVSGTGYINIYAYGSVDGGATYTESFGGTDAAITLASPPNAVLIAQINANVASTTYRAGPYSYCRTVGMDRLPQYWGVFVVNETGAAFGATATTQAITYQGVNGQL